MLHRIGGLNLNLIWIFLFSLRSKYSKVFADLIFLSFMGRMKIN